LREELFVYFVLGVYEVQGRSDRTKDKKPLLSFFLVTNYKLLIL